MDRMQKFIETLEALAVIIPIGTALFLLCSWLEMRNFNRYTGSDATFKDAIFMELDIGEELRRRQ